MGQAKSLANDIIFLHKGFLESQVPIEDFLNAPPSDAARQFLAGDIVI